ncbi:MAG: hypothetical protein IOMNBAOH_02043 [Rhodocyclaceae bacterium]|nr:hypothetical protein [Rhodocyclaceae bacterium]
MPVDDAACARALPPTPSLAGGLPDHPLFRPWLGWLDELPPECLADPTRLDHALARSGRPRTHQGQVIHFCAPADDALAYETRIARFGAVATRPHCWHDLFNALVWHAFPLTKAALNARHVEAATAVGARGPVRDALTHFDEDGIVVLHAAPGLVGALRAHRWREVFWARRVEWEAGVRVIVFGHALLDKLRQPFFGLCGKAVFLRCRPDRLAWPAAALMRHADVRLARILARRRRLSSRGLQALPVLALPGMTEANRQPEYFDDTRQFRPSRMGPGGNACAVPDGRG